LPTTYSYNEAGDMASAQVGKEITLYSFDGNGQLVSVLHPNGILDERSYDAAGRLTRITGTAPHGKPFYSRSYTYDPVGNPTRDDAGCWQRQLPLGPPPKRHPRRALLRRGGTPEVSEPIPLGAVGGNNGATSPTETHRDQTVEIGPKSARKRSFSS
jgi:YD repeat-containing protein